MHSPELRVALVAELEVALLTLGAAGRNVAVLAIAEDARVLAGAALAILLPIPLVVAFEASFTVVITVVAAGHDLVAFFERGLTRAIADRHERVVALSADEYGAVQALDAGVEGMEANLLE